MKYYGVRYSKNCQPSDLWISYKTSSDYVKSYVELFGDPTIIEIRKIFTGENKISDAIKWESAVLRRVRAATRSDFLNKRDSAGINYTDPEVADKRNTNMRKSISSHETKEKRKLVESLPKTKEKRKVAALTREADPIKKANRLSKAFSKEANEKRKKSLAMTNQLPEVRKRRSEASKKMNSRPEILKINKEKNSGLNNARAIQTLFVFKNEITAEEKRITCYEMTQYLRSIGIKYGCASTLVKHANTSLAGWKAVLNDDGV